MDKLIRNLPLQIFLIVPFVIIVLASGGVTGYLAFHNSQNSINELANQLYGELTSRIQQHLGNYLTTPYLINQLNLDAIRLGELNVQDTQSLERHFSPQLRQFDSAMSIAYADEQQNYVGIQLIGAAGLAQGTDQILAIAGKNTNHVLQEISIDAQGRQLEQTWASPPGYDPRSRPWYRAAVQAGGSTWTPIFMWSSGTVGLDAVTPVYSDGTDQKRLLGVLDTSLTLTSIGDFLQQLNISEHGQTFIMERSGLLVASSSVKEPYTRTGSDLNRLSAFNATEPVVRATSQYLEAHFGNLAVIESSQRLHFDLNGETQTVQVTPYHDQYGLDWLIVLVIPESDFMGQIAANSQSTGLLIAILLLASVIVAILITRWVTQPILRLNSAAKALTAGDWTQRVVVGRTDEVGALASSFNWMAEQLQGAFASLQRSEERYRSLFDGVPIGLHRTTPEGQILDANPALVQMLGFPDQQSLLLINAVEGYLVPDVREQWQNQMAREEVVRDFQAQVRRQDGTGIWLQNIGRIIRDDLGQPLYYEGSVEDITKRKQAEAVLAATALENARLYEEIQRHANELEQHVQLRTAELNRAKDHLEAILNNSSDVIVLTGTDGTIHEINPVGNRLLGYESGEVVGQPLTILASLSSAASLLQTLDTVVMTQQPARLEIITAGKYGVGFDADVAISPIIGHDGETLDLVYSLRDITAQKLLEMELRQMLQKAIELGELKSRFVSMLSHEFRTQLAVIQSTNDLLNRYEGKFSSERKHAEFGRIRKSVENIVMLVDDVLNFSQVEAGSLVLTPERVNLEIFCRDLLADLIRAIGERPMFEFSSSGDCANIVIDPKLLRYILGNLLSNAIKYSPSNTPVSLDLICRKDQAVFRVTDKGLGIPEADQRRLFEAFHRAKNVGSIPGTGLGLTIVKQSVDIHQGSITFESKEGVGTTFTVTIPSATAASSEDQ